MGDEPLPAWAKQHLRVANEKLAAMRAEAERLRGALERIQAMADEGGIASPDDVLAVGLIAARALAATPGGPNAK